MNSKLVNNELSVQIPDGFAEMEDDELKQAFGDGYPNRWGIHDDARHMVFVVQWKESSETLGRLVSTRSLVNRAQKAQAKGLRNNNYVQGEDIEAQLAGMPAEGFAYSYALFGVPQQAEIIILKHGKTCFTLYYITQANLADNNRATYDELLGALSF